MSWVQSMGANYKFKDLSSLNGRHNFNLDKPKSQVNPSLKSQKVKAEDFGLGTKILWATTLTSNF